MQHHSLTQSHPCDRNRLMAVATENTPTPGRFFLLSDVPVTNLSPNSSLIFVQMMVPLVMAAADRCLRISSQRRMMALSISTESSRSSTSGRTDAIL